MNAPFVMCLIRRGKTFNYYKIIINQIFFWVKGFLDVYFYFVIYVNKYLDIKNGDQFHFAS